jgi:hypothetical protein
MEIVHGVQPNSAHSNNSAQTSRPAATYT